MEFFRDLLPLLTNYVAEKERIERVIRNSKPIVDEWNKAKGTLVSDLKELARVFFPGALDQPKRQAKRPKMRKRK